jgi:TolA-binding protein
MMLRSKSLAAFVALLATGVTVRNQDREPTSCRRVSLKTPFLFTIITAALLASTSLVYAIDPNASAVLQKENQEAVAKDQNMQERITRMEDQIARMNEELIAVREQKIQDQERLHRLEQMMSAAR